MRPKMESELLRTKIDACHVLESKLQEKLITMQRTIGSTLMAEKMVTMADHHSATLTSEFEVIEQLLPQVNNVCIIWTFAEQFLV